MLSLKVPVQPRKLRNEHLHAMTILKEEFEKYAENPKCADT